MEEARRNEKLYTVQEIANLINVSRSFAYELIKRGRIRHIKIGRLRRVKHSALIEYIKKNEIRIA